MGAHIRQKNCIFGRKEIEAPSQSFSQSPQSTSTQLLTPNFFFPRLCIFFSLFRFLFISLDTAVERCCSFSDLLCLLSGNLVGLIYSRLDDLLLLGAQRFGQILVELGLLLLENCEVLLVICL
jgi:hypothetical protein